MLNAKETAKLILNLIQPGIDTEFTASEAEVLSI